MKLNSQDLNLKNEVIGGKYFMGNYKAEYYIKSILKQRHTYHIPNRSKKIINKFAHKWYFKMHS